MPISVSVNAYKETQPTGGTAPRTLYLQVRVYQSATGNGVAGKTVTVVVQWSDASGQHTDYINVGPTDADGYAQVCSGNTYPLNAQLTVGTQPVPNPPGGAPAPGLSTVTVQKSGPLTFCN